MRGLFRHVGPRAPIAVAALIAVPLYFAALMASSLALDKPRIVGAQEFPSTGTTEAKIWLAALIAPGILIAAGLLGMLLGRLGAYLPAAAGIVVCILLPGLSQPWVGRHTSRFPIGIDFVKDSNPSNLATRGEWERSAHATIVSIAHWTLGLAIGVVVIGVLLEWRRRRGRDAIIVEPPPPGTGGAPQITAP